LKGKETGFLELTFATNPRNRVSLDHLCYQQTNFIETRFLVPGANRNLKRLETGLKALTFAAAIKLY
jgi:hypothetical protein